MNYKRNKQKSIIFQYFYYDEFQVDFKSKRAYVKDDIKGDIARIYFYMSDKYNINLSKQERKLFEVWNKIDPVSKWEIIKNDRVLELQGNSNPYVKQFFKYKGFMWVNLYQKKLRNYQNKS